MSHEAVARHLHLNYVPGQPTVPWEQLDEDERQAWLAEVPRLVELATPSVNDWPATETERSEYMRALLGKPVVVTLQRKPNRSTVAGTLLSFSEDGEVVVRDETGMAHFCWPNLETTEGDE